MVDIFVFHFSIESIGVHFKIMLQSYIEKITEVRYVKRKNRCSRRNRWDCRI